MHDIISLYDQYVVLIFYNINITVEIRTEYKDLIIDNMNYC